MSNKVTFVKIHGLERPVTDEQLITAEALFRLVKDIPEEATTEELLKYSGFWPIVSKVFDIWAKTDPDGVEEYAQNTKDIRGSLIDERLAMSKNKNIQWTARLPFRLIAMMNKLFPKLTPTKEFVRQFVSRYKAFAVAGR